MSKVSIIMPIYNAEKYLREAIESVLNQTYEDFELLLINDKSTDKSKDICSEYMQRDGRIVLLENNSDRHGPGATRNIGLDYATGDYIYFMDADDWVEKTLLQCAVNRMLETDANIVLFGVMYHRNDGVYFDQYYWKGKNLLTKDEIKDHFLNFWEENRKSLWLHLFRQDTVKTIRFENIISGEDVSYILDALSKAEKIAYIAKPLYHYRYVEGSTSHRWNKETIKCIGSIWDHQKNYLKSFQEELDILAYTEVAYDNYISAIYQLSSKLCKLSYEDKKRELLHLKEKMEFDEYRNMYPIELQHGLQKVKYMLVKYRLEGIILFLGPAFLRIVRGE
ncbi:MAG: glycosyltransferase family 2 protein [bacterium]|nr:glycosyltransferase family 2 protein [bacterium]MDY5456860.1 glycosyltransferase family 2 protein [Bariatricus sp.]